MIWRELKLGEAIHVKHGYAFKGNFFADTGEFIVLTPGNFHETGGFRLRPDKDRAYSGAIPETYILCESDLIIAMTEQGAGLLGSSALVPQGNRYLHNQRLGLVDKIDPSILDKRFLYLLFNTGTVRGQLSGSATGTKVRHTAPERIYQVEVRVPRSVKEQSTIADAVLAYDNLIENNNRRIKLLEESARLLYQQWFVRLRFPGHEHTRIVDGVPAGWERKSLDELTTFLKRGITPIYDEDADGLVINQKCVRNNWIDLDLARRQSKTVKTERLLQVGDVLVNSTGEGTLGRVAQLKAHVERCTVDTHVTIVRPKPEIGRHYFGLAIVEWEDRFAKMGRGATNQTELSPKAIGETIITVPSIQLMVRFEAFANPLYGQIVNLVFQNKKLRTARDLLLPRLMNGEITV
jgi:type I restriction enzyme, S subunit